MSYKNDSYLVIANKFGSASSEAKAQLFETYDQLRDITVSGASGSTGACTEAAGGFLYNLASLLSPSSFMTTMGGNTSYNVPGTSYYSGGTTSSSSYGLETYSGFAASIDGCSTGEACSILSGYGSATGGASSIGGIADIATSTAYAAGTASGFTNFGRGLLLQSAGIISGIGGIAEAAAPYMGEYGLGAIIAGNVMQGTGSAA